MSHCSNTRLSAAPSMRPVLVIFLSMLLLTSCGSSEESESVAPDDLPQDTFTNVVVHELALQTWQGSINTFGVVEALEEVNIAAELSGTVRAIHVNEGDRVEVGQLLLELDPQKRQFAEQQANQQVEKTRAALKEARLKLNRRKNLADKETISKEVLDSSQLDVEAATAAFQQAVASAQLATRELEDTKIYSPTSGLIDIKAVEAGEPVAAGATLVTLQAVESLRMHTWVSEADISYVRAGAKALVTASGTPNRSYEARVEWVGVNADPKTGNFPVKLILTDHSDVLRPGMTASAVLAGISVPNTLLLPETALVNRDRRRVVFVVEGEKSEVREPILAAGFSNRLHVIDGLSAGDKVVTAGHDFLRDGSRVVIQEEN